MSIARADGAGPAFASPVVRPVTAGERARFARDGFVVLRGLFSPWAVADLADELARAHGTRDADRALARDSFVWRSSRSAAAFACDADLGAVASELLGCAGVRLLHDVVFEKSRGHVATEWHRDADFWPIAGGRALTFWLPLQDTPRAMGPLRYAIGSHEPIATLRGRLSRLTKHAIALRYRVRTHDLSAGDVVAHDSRTYHSASRNRTEAVRRAYAIHVMDARCRYVASDRPRMREHADRCGWTSLSDGMPFPDRLAPRLGAPPPAR